MNSSTSSSSHFAQNVIEQGRRQFLALDRRRWRRPTRPRVFVAYSSCSAAKLGKLQGDTAKPTSLPFEALHILASSLVLKHRSAPSRQVAVGAVPELVDAHRPRRRCPLPPIVRDALFHRRLFSGLLNETRKRFSSGVPCDDGSASGMTQWQCTSTTRTGLPSISTRRRDPAGLACAKAPRRMRSRGRRRSHPPPDAELTSLKFH